jgi:hypothetical protein
MLTPRWRRPSDLRMSKPTLISSTGSAARDPDGVADAGPQHRADADRGLHRAGAQGPGLGDAQVQRAVDGLGQLVVGGDGHERVGRLHRDLELVEVVVLQDAGVVQGALDHRLGARLAVLLQQFALQGAGIDADAHRAAVVAGRLDHFTDAVGGADIARIDPQAGGAGLGRLDAALVVEVDVGHERHPRLAGDGLERRRAVGVGAADPDDVGPGLFQLTDLLQRRGGVAGQGVGHRLDGDRRVAAHLDIADADLARLPARDHAPGTDVPDFFVGVVCGHGGNLEGVRGGTEGLPPPLPPIFLLPGKAGAQIQMRLGRTYGLRQARERLGSIWAPAFAGERF